MNSRPRNLVSSVPVIAAGSVDVWVAKLAWHHHAVTAAVELLSPDERSRADRFHDSVERTHFIVARAILRLLLSKYLGTGPEEISFCYSLTGKPFIADRGINFNLAHSDGTAVYTFASNREIGVDLERVRIDFPAVDVARQFFAPEELRNLLAFSEADMVTAFYRCWTRKEAYAKARGFGLLLPLDSFVVSMQATDGSLLYADDGDPEAADRWRLFDLPQIEGDGFAGAIAVECRAGEQPPVLRFRRFTQRFDSGTVFRPDERDWPVAASC
jgi:4'-phosphopantetheinyl transferase